MGLFLREASARIGSDDVPVRIDGLMDRGSFLPILRRGPGRSGPGPRGHDPLVLFKGLPVGQRHGLKVRPDFMLSCGRDLHAAVPDETTRCRFRNALVKGGVSDALPSEVCRRIEGHGLKLAEAAIVDATLVAAAARPRTTIRPSVPAPIPRGAMAEEGIDLHAGVQGPCPKRRGRPCRQGPHDTGQPG